MFIPTSRYSQHPHLGCHHGRVPYLSRVRTIPSNRPCSAHTPPATGHCPSAPRLGIPLSLGRTRGSLQRGCERMQRKRPTLSGLTHPAPRPPFWHWRPQSHMVLVVHQQICGEPLASRAGCTNSFGKPAPSHLRPGHAHQPVTTSLHLVL